MASLVGDEDKGELYELETSGLGGKVTFDEDGIEGKE